MEHPCLSSNLNLTSNIEVQEETSPDICHCHDPQFSPPLWCKDIATLPKPPVRVGMSYLPSPKELELALS